MNVGILCRRASSVATVFPKQSSSGLIVTRLTDWGAKKKPTCSACVRRTRYIPSAAPPLAADTAECCPTHTVISPCAEAQRFHPINGIRAVVGLDLTFLIRGVAVR